MRHRRSFIIPGVVSALIVAASLILALPAAAATIAPTTTCSNGVDNTGGLGLICEVTVINTITASGGSASVTVRECHGAAGAPDAACTTTTTALTAPVTQVTQCNDAINGGGGTLRCSVRVTNNFMALGAGPSDVTVNQCVGSGGGITTGCDPFPATTTGATITQCNGSANGGTLVGLTCTATGRTSSVHRVRINQCNGSANGGGALVICSADVRNHIIGAVPTATPRPAAAATRRPTSGLPNTNTTEPLDTERATDPLALAGILVFVSGSLFVGLRRYGARRKTH